MTPATAPSAQRSPSTPKPRQAFQAEGEFQMGRVRQHFAIQVAASDEAAARDRICATLGSRHGVNRRQVWFSSVRPVSGDEVTDAAVRRALGL